MNVQPGRPEVISPPRPGPDAGLIEQAAPALPARTWLVRRRRSIIGWAVLAVVFAMATATRGIPLSEDTVLIWLAAVLFVASLDDLRRWRRGVLRDWLPLYFVLVFYALLRGYASHVLWGPFIHPQVAFDRFIGFGAAPTVRLQKWLFNPHDLHVWDYACWAVYMSHFFTSYTVAGVLWKRNHERFRRYIALFVGLTFAGYVGYALYPAVPPWMASRDGTIGYAARIIPDVWERLGVHQAAALFTHGSKFANDVAAMPSLHAAYPVLLLLFFWAGARWWVRMLLAGYVLAMAFTLVYTGEHFVIDVFVGWAFASAVYFGGSWLLDRLAVLRWRRRVSLGLARLPRADASQPVPEELADPESSGAAEPAGPAPLVLSSPARTSAA